MGNGQKLWNRAKEIIPGGNMLLSKRPEMFLPEKWPCYFSKAKGYSVWDLDGRKLITSANGEKLTDAQRSELMGHVSIISENWEKVIAESVFKYAGSTYKSLVALEDVSNADLAKEFDKYMKYWGELKGFSMALQVGKDNIGETGTKLNRMVGFGPMLLDETQIVGIDVNGNYVMDKIYSMNDAKLHMLKIQKLMIDQFGIEARANDMLSDMADLASKIGTSESAEND